MALIQRYVTVAGAGAHDGTSVGAAWTIEEAFAGYAAGQQVNIASGTYTPSSSLTFATTAADSQPVLFTGAETRPVVNFGTTGYSMRYDAGVHGIHLEGLKITANSNTQAPFVATGNGEGKFVRDCIIENLGTDMAADLLYATMVNCYFSNTGTSDYAVEADNDSVFLGCVFESSYGGVDSTTSWSALIVSNCLFKGTSGSKQGSAIRFDSGGGDTRACMVYGCTFDDWDYGVYIDRTTSVSGCNSGLVISNNIYSDINKAVYFAEGPALPPDGGARPASINARGNAFYAVTDNYDNYNDASGYGLVISGDIELTASPFGTGHMLNDTSGGGALLKAAATPGDMLDGTNINYLDVGALQRQESAVAGPNTWW